MRRLAGVLALTLTLGACGGSGDAPAPAASSAPAAAFSPEDFRTALPMKELMGHVIDSAADGIWLHQGWTVTAEGETDLFPKTDEEWLATENAALTLAEASNLLLLPGRPQDEDRAWVEFAHKLNVAAMKTHDAAEARDEQAFFDAGGDIFVVCRDCHRRYIIGE